jgi:hypothetical protein
MPDMNNYVGDDTIENDIMHEVAIDTNLTRVSVFRTLATQANPGFDGEVGDRVFSHSIYARIDIYKRNSPEFIGLTDNRDVRLEDYWYILDRHLGMRQLEVKDIVLQGNSVQVRLEDNAG